MAKFYSELNDELTAFIQAQKLFFTASAPLSAEGHVNLSPKGMDTLRVLDARTVVYLDLTGSGNETAAHLRENGRLTLMFCSFEAKPLILRLYGQGRAVHPGSSDWEPLRTRFTPLPGLRQMIVLSVTLVQTSCGFGVPLYDFRAERPTLVRYAESKGEDGLREYRREKNVRSIDGLPTGLVDAQKPDAQNLQERTSR